jgi:hypothetical protein
MGVLAKIVSPNPFPGGLSERLVRRRIREVSPKRIPETEEPTQRNGRLLTHLIASPPHFGRFRPQ